MAGITPEEQVQKVKAPLLEDLEFEPEQVRNFFVTNLFSRVFAHLVGWTGKNTRMLRCTTGGELKTAPTTTGIENYYNFNGQSPDTWGPILTWPNTVSRVDVFVWDYPMQVRFWNPAETWGYVLEVPVGFYSVDYRTSKAQVQNKTAGQTARYQIVGWW